MRFEDNVEITEENKKEDWLTEEVEEPVVGKLNEGSTSWKVTSSTNNFQEKLKKAVSDENLFKLENLWYEGNKPYIQEVILKNTVEGDYYLEIVLPEELDFSYLYKLFTKDKDYKDFSSCLHVCKIELWWTDLVAREEV